MSGEPQKSGQRPAPLRLLILSALACLAAVLFNAILRAASGPGLPSIPLPNRAGETLLLFAGLVMACVLADRLLLRNSTGSATTPLDRQTRLLKQLVIGVPEGMVHLEVMRDRQLLEQRLLPFGVSVVWRSFNAASSMLEALGNGEVTFCGGGGTASLFAQAAELVFLRVARDKYTNPFQDAILVQEGSTIETVANLKGKRIAVDQGSSAHMVLITALRQFGLDLSDVEIVYLSQPEALPQFRSGDIDAWAIWMPYEATETRKAYPGRTIATVRSVFGGDPTTSLPTLYYAVPELVRDSPEVLKLLLEEVNEAGCLATKQELGALELLNNRIPVDSSTLEDLRSRAFERAVVPLDNQVLRALQSQAQILRDLGLIPRRINVFDGTYSLIARQNWTY